MVLFSFKDHGKFEKFVIQVFEHFCEIEELISKNMKSVSDLFIGGIKILSVKNRKSREN